MTTVRRPRKGATYRPYRPNRPKAKRSKGLRADGVSFVPSTYRPPCCGNAESRQPRSAAREANGSSAGHRSPSTPYEKAAVGCCVCFAKKSANRRFWARNGDSMFKYETRFVFASSWRCATSRGEIRPELMVFGPRVFGRTQPSEHGSDHVSNGAGHWPDTGRTLAVTGPENGSESIGDLEWRNPTLHPP